jgi:hypothetical protein
LDLPSDDAPADAPLSIVYFRDQVKAAFDEAVQKDIFHSIMIGTTVLPMKTSEVGRSTQRRGRGNLLVFIAVDDEEEEGSVCGNAVARRIHGMQMQLSHKCRGCRGYNGRGGSSSYAPF